MRHALQETPSAPGFESASELPREISLEVEGVAPAWLRGRLIHTGPALFALPRGAYNHWFDGLAMLTGVHFGERGVTYRSRFLRSDAYCLAMARGEPVLGEFDTRTRYRAHENTDNANVNVADLGGRVIAMTESSRHVEVDPMTLDTRGELRYDDELDGQVSTAHPTFDTRRGVLHNLLVRFGARSVVQIYEQRLGTQRRELVASLHADRPSYMHSFGASERFIILSEIPLIVNPLRLRFGRRPYIEAYQWRPERGTRLRVISKADGAVVATATLEPMFTFHHVQAFEHDGVLHIDLLAYPDPSVISDLRLAVLRSPAIPSATARLVRITMRDDVLDQRVEPIQLTPTWLELPRVDPRCTTLPYRHVFGVANEHRRDFFDRVVKIDVETGAAQSFVRDGWFFNEPLFVAGPCGAGIVMSIVFDAAERTSRLVMLDPETLELAAQTKLPQLIPFHFHGGFVPE
jgi:beta,beta-carotene 9',10'-dioxygenase